MSVCFSPVHLCLSIYKSDYRSVEIVSLRFSISGHGHLRPHINWQYSILMCLWLLITSMHYSDCRDERCFLKLMSLIGTCSSFWSCRSDGVGGGGNVGEGYEKLIFAILRLSVIIASGAGMPRCPACRIICGGNEVWNSSSDSTGSILFLSMTYDCCAIYVYCDTIWLGLLKEVYVGTFLIMSIWCVTYNRYGGLFILQL